MGSPAPPGLSCRHTRSPNAHRTVAVGTDGEEPANFKHPRKRTAKQSLIGGGSEPVTVKATAGASGQNVVRTHEGHMTNAPYVSQIINTIILAATFIYTWQAVRIARGL